MSDHDYTTDPDVQLMLDFQAGDKQAFETLMRKYFPRVLNFIYRYVGQRELAEELTQEVFIKVYKTAHKYTVKSKLQTWLFTIAKNASLNELRRHHHRDYSLDASVEGDEGSMSGQHMDQRAVDPSQALLDKERSLQIREAILSLPDNQRAAVLLRRYEQMSYDEIAAALKIGPKAVKSLLNRAKENLRERLKHLLME